MTQLAHGPAGSPADSPRARPRAFGLIRGFGRATPPPAAVASDEQILALVAAAESLSRRQRDRNPDISNGSAGDRLLRLDWAVRTGRSVLAERATQALTPPGTLTTGAGQPRRRW